MRVLVTRPEPAARQTARRLRQLGYQPVLLPLSRAVHTPEEAQAALGKPFGALIVTSAEALRSIGPFLSDSVKSTRIFCVGPATAQAAARAGFTDRRVAEGTGISLAALIRDAFPIPPALPFLYLAGTPRSPDLEAGLLQTGLPLVTCICYRMETLVYEAPAALEAVPDIVLLYSRENTSRFFSLPAVREAPQRFEHTLFLCISAKAAAAVPPAFRANALAAATPDEPGLFALLPSPSSQI